MAASSPQYRPAPQILILTDVFSPIIGGAGAVCEALASHLPHHVLLVASARQEIAAAVHSWAGFDGAFPFRVFRVPRFASFLSPRIPGKLRGPLQGLLDLALVRPAVAARLWWKLRRAHLDVVCVNTLLPCYWLPQWLQKTRPNLKVVFYLHGEEVNDGPSLRRIERDAQRTLLRADAVVTVSSFTARRAERCGVPPEKITTILNGVDTARFSPGPADTALLESLGVLGKPLLLCLARLDERKGQDNLIRAMAQIRASVPEATLLLVGGGSDHDRLLSIARETGTDDAVLFTGRVPADQIQRFYRSADVYIMPNRTTESGDTEGFGLVFLEAGACGKPVIGGNAGGVPDAILDGQTGLLVDGTSVDDIAQACIRLLVDPALRSRMGTCGLERSRELSWKHQSERFLDLCTRLVDRTAP